MNSGIHYPSLEDLKWFTEYLQDESNTHYLRKYLPKIDTKWTSRVMQKIEFIQLPYYKREINYQAALLFYKINKAHSEIDSNKRSAILATYLFLLVNNKYFLEPNNVRLLAKKIAKSKGRKREDYWIEKTRSYFSEKLGDI